MQSLDVKRGGGVRELNLLSGNADDDEELLGGTPFVVIGIISERSGTLFA